MNWEFFKRERGRPQTCTVLDLGPAMYRGFTIVTI